MERNLRRMIKTLQMQRLQRSEHISPRPSRFLHTRWQLGASRPVDHHHHYAAMEMKTLQDQIIQKYHQIALKMEGTITVERAAAGNEEYSC
ncbi:hypothetical protein Patl1_19001 [Pistacia atlantica]|uniref:Uncharacterized protein n=1 Tax=Pistacia atlantica TaxID=434234 RepID=A0ACC1BY88_9ROSI|nr:hypothetical protein Patl1_19001 [Pistacia atlantica]